MKTIFTSLLFFYLLISPVHAALVLWTAPSDGDWHVGSNWHTGNVPGASDDAVIISNVVITISSGTANANSITLQGGGDLTVANGASLVISNTSTNPIKLDSDGSILTNNGTITLTNTSALQFLKTGTTLLNDTDGTFNIVSPKGEGVTGNLTTASYTFENRGIFSISDSQDLSDGEGFDLRGRINFINSGSLTIDNPGSDDTGIFLVNGTANETWSNSGSIIIKNHTNDGLFIIGKDFINTGILRSESNANPTFRSSGGILSNASGGDLQGLGTIDASAFQDDGGSISPGLSPGILSFDEGEDLSESSFNIEIDNNDGVAGQDYDQIILNTGSLTLGGTSTLNLTFNYTPDVGHNFSIISAPSIVGNFNTINHNLPGTLAVTFNASTGIITVESALPVNLISFESESLKEGILLKWNASQEENMDGYEVQKRMNNNWESINLVEINNSITDPKKYSYLDDSPSNGKNYYRLKPIDRDGNHTYSQIIFQDWLSRNPFNNLKIFPNPVSNGSFSISLNDFESEPIHFSLINSSGQILHSEFLNAHHTLIDVSNFPPGLYFISLVFNNQRQVRKILLDNNQ